MAEQEPFELVYQVGIANLFQGERRVYQGDYRTAESLARGVELAGGRVLVQHCDKAGDVAALRAGWRDGAGELWADQKRAPKGS